MAYVVTVDTRVPRIDIHRILPWWLRTQRQSLEDNERLLTAEETEDRARVRFGSTIQIIDIALSIDLTEEQMFRHVVESSEQAVLPQEHDRELVRGDVTRAGRPKDFKCAICLKKTGRVVRTRCRHYFHRDCIERSFRYDTRCPTCRQEIRQIQ